MADGRRYGGGPGGAVIVLTILVVLGVVVVVALVYWHLIAAEGAYLGPKVVAWTYDWAARRYDTIKQFRPEDEDWFVARPVLRGLMWVERPLVLDVATGTGRLPLALLRNHLAPNAQIVGLDLSRAMLKQARAKLRPFGDDRVSLVWHEAEPLPFDDETFDAVTCLEALEFMPRPREALAEMVRVLAPGGLLLVTNRVGIGARLLPGRAISRPEFQEVLAALPLTGIEARSWQVDYDLVAAFKVGQRNPAGHGEAAGADKASLLRCPACGEHLELRAGVAACAACGQQYAIEDGIVTLAEKRGIRQ